MLQIAEYGEGLVVYSLGITLIEMFTGRSPTDDMFWDGLSLYYFAEAALPDKVMEIADPESGFITKQTREMLQDI